MSAINENAVRAIEQCSVELYNNGVPVIVRLLENVIREPHNQKYRKVRLENKVIKEKVLSIQGARELLLQIGFVQKNDELILPPNVLIATLKQYKDCIASRIEAVNICSQSDAQPVEAVIAAEPAAGSSKGAIKKRAIAVRSDKSYVDKITFPSVVPFFSNFLATVEKLSDSFMQYEDKNLQEYCVSLIPLQKLMDQAMNQSRKLQKLIASGKLTENEPCFKDLLLTELCSWFNAEFFTWINKLPCKVCGKEDTKAINHSNENGIRVEEYMCCNQISKFYRYNDVRTLLQTRKGRCGEYANCFTFLCRSLGFETRYVYSDFDHVWTEVYSIAQRRWIHVDPSDNVIDSPLMYEHGWKRAVCYVLAFTQDDVQDVTWRYTNNKATVLKRRTSCTEAELLKTIKLLRSKRQTNSSSARVKFLKKRTLFELVEFMRERQPTEAELKGRSSGSFEWKMLRGEQEKINNFYIFSANAENIESKQFNLRYSCAKDTYESYLTRANGEPQVCQAQKGWASWHYTSNNVFRKVETDWKMAYIARIEDTDRASVAWKFDFKSAGLKIKTISLKFETKSYENAVILTEIENERGEIVSGIENVKDSKFTITATLSGGKGEQGWQHTQLFRQGINSRDYPFVLSIVFW